MKIIDVITYRLYVIFPEISEKFTTLSINCDVRPLLAKNNEFKDGTIGLMSPILIIAMHYIATFDTARRLLQCLLPSLLHQNSNQANTNPMYQV